MAISLQAAIAELERGAEDTAQAGVGRGLRGTGTILVLLGGRAGAAAERSDHRAYPHSAYLAPVAGLGGI